jgi:hypothetical protein
MSLLSLIYLLSVLFSKWSFQMGSSTLYPDLYHNHRLHEEFSKCTCHRHNISLFGTTHSGLLSLTFLCPPFCLFLWLLTEQGSHSTLFYVILCIHQIYNISSMKKSQRSSKVQKCTNFWPNHNAHGNSEKFCWSSLFVSCLIYI